MRVLGLPVPSNFLILICLVIFGPVHASVSIDTRSMQLEFSEYGDLLSMQACLPGCEHPEALKQRFTSYRGLVSINRDSDGLFTFERNDGDHSIQIVFQNLVSGESRRWRIPHQGYLLGLELSRPQGLSLASGEDFQPRPSSGFSAWLERLRYVRIIDGKVSESGLQAGHSIDLAGQYWAGYRSRFWAALIRPEQETSITSRASKGPYEAQLDLYSTAAGPHRFTVYAGPVERYSLENANSELGRLMYPGTGHWSGWILRALHSALNTFYTLIHHAGASVILLALLVQAILWPIYRYVEKTQARVRETEARLAPQISDIRHRFQGEEQSQRIKAVYRQENVHPFYRLKGLLGLVVVVPVLVCTYHLLAEDIWLLNAPFLWVSDLSMPDAALNLPLYIPLVGEQLNLLPLMVFVLMIAAAGLRKQPVVTADSGQAKSRNSWALPWLSLLLFYTLPAGMVLFWATVFAVIFGSRLVGTSLAHA